ncbi:uncharacterized protein LOC124656267 [Lolium rigidum]|uniref:uncharacterized protein LOC124656267 n=1 Tax=Lolium rigidum TaxID=89674 RepID=UPI001F5CA1A6|nr:uncharacterized protein LOC124656267 [Lolium rigidum]
MESPPGTFPTTSKSSSPPPVRPNGRRWQRQDSRGHHGRRVIAVVLNGSTDFGAGVRAAVVRVRGPVDQPELHGDRVQQVHPGPQDVRLALPHLPHHDPHGLLRLPRRRARPRPPPRRPPLRPSHDLLPLRRHRRAHRRALRALPLVLQLRLHLPLRLLHPDAQGAHARRRLLPRRRLPHRLLPQGLHAQHARHLRGRRRRRARGGALRRLRRHPPARRRRRRGHAPRAHPDAAHLQGNQAQPHHLALLHRALLPALPRRAVDGRRAAEVARGGKYCQPGPARVRHKLPLRVRAQPGSVPAGGEDVRADHERGRGGQGLAPHRLLLDRHQGHRHGRQPRWLRHRLPRRSLLQPRQAAGAQGKGGREEGGLHIARHGGGCRGR